MARSTQGIATRRVLVTGASAGIGQACADRLHESGWQVVGASRRATASGGWQSMSMDIDDDQSVAEGMAQVLAAGRLDAVVACAGWGLAGPVEQTPMEEARHQMETNFWGAVRVVRHALPAMRQQRAGRIVLLSSIGGIVAIPFQAFYSASKFALEGYGEALAYEVARFGIQVVLVEPGNVRTDFTDNRRDCTQPDDPAYGATATRAIAKMAADEGRGVPPAVAAASVQRALEMRHPPRRLSVGRLDERIGIMAKRLLPFRAFERGARASLGV